MATTRKSAATAKSTVTTKAPKAAATTKAPKAAATTKAPAPAPAPVVTTPANPFAALVAPATATPAGPVPKIHSMALGTETVTCANHTAIIKGARPVLAVLAKHTYTLGYKLYSPKDGTLNAVQWRAVLAGLQAGGTGAAIEAEFKAAGLQAGHVNQFVPYALKAGWLAVA